ncbi:MAG: MarC family protein [Pseudomonadota bacterium]|nr:MarC family protein [Pseudomonadota bacterium]
MQDIGGQALAAFMGFFAIMNPVANTPIFLSLTDGEDKATRRAVAFRAILVSFAILVVFCLVGHVIFNMFGITLPAFQITGGILVFLIGFHMLQGTNSPVHHPPGVEDANSRDTELGVAVTPLAMPILAGPGTIATAMNFVGDGGMVNIGVTLAAVLAICLITFVSFIFGERLVRYLGDSGIKVLTRLMGLILAVIGTQMVVTGVTAVMH